MPLYHEKDTILTDNENPCSMYGMRVAISEWQGRISPVFDAATHLLIADVENETSTGKHTVQLRSDGVQSRAQEVASHNVDMLI